MSRLILAAACVTTILVMPALSTRAPGLLAVSGLCSGTLGQYGWQCETVDAAGDVGSSSILQYAANGAVRIAYNTYRSGLGGSLHPKTALKYAERAPAGSWSVATVDGSVGYPAALLENPANGRPQIGYDCARLASYSGTAWSTQAIVSRGCGSRDQVSFAYDGSGDLWVTYSDGKRQLVVGKRTANAWAFETLPHVATYKSLAIMSDDRPAVAFGNDVNALMFAKRQPDGSWAFTTVEQTANSGYSFVASPKLILDANGTPTIGYWGGAIRLARLVSGQWIVETARARVPGESVTGIWTTFANGEPVMSFTAFFSGVGTTIYVLRKSLTGDWGSSSVDVLPASNVTTTSVAYDATRGVVGVSYGPRDVNDLKFAEGPPAAIGQ